MIRIGLISDMANLNRLVMRPLPQLFDRAVATVESEADIGNEAEGVEARTGKRAVVTVRLEGYSRTLYHVISPKAVGAESPPQALVDQAVQEEMDRRRLCPQSAPSRPPRWDAAIANTCTRRTRLKVAQTSTRSASLEKDAKLTTMPSLIKISSRNGKRSLR